MRQQVTKRPQRVHKCGQREHDPQEFRQQSQVGLSCHVSLWPPAPVFLNPDLPHHG
jgi:hypothetical protein